MSDTHSAEREREEKEKAHQRDQERAKEHAAQAKEKLEAARKVLEENREASNKSREAAEERSKYKPTPTQEENDLAKLGVPVPEKEDDGSPPDPHNTFVTRQVEAKKPASQTGYQTRTVGARPAPTKPE